VPAATPFDDGPGNALYAALTMMHSTQTVAAAVLTVCFATACLAGGKPGEESAVQQPKTATSRSGDASLAKMAAASTSSPTAVNSNSEVFQNIVVTAGASYPIDSTLDYTSAATVAITLECQACDSAKAALGASGLTLEARWSVPGATLLVAAESVPATNFFYWDAGSALFDVYGSQFRLVLQNKGTASITIDQIVLFQRSQ
jgi:hypothetical protein